MLNKIFLVSLLCSVSSIAYANSTLTKEKNTNYLVLYSGNSSWKNTSNSNQIESGTEGWGIGITLGKEYLPSLSIEFDASYRNNPMHGVNFGNKRLSIDGNDLNILNLGLNLKYKYNLSDQLNIYVFGGPGLAFFKNNNSKNARSIDFKTESLSTIQTGIGANYMFSENWGLILGYRYLTGLENIKLKYNNKNLEDNYHSNMIYSGIIYKF